MRQLARWLGKGFRIGTLILPWVLIVAMALVWIRGHYYSDNFRLTLHRVSSGTTHVNILSALFTRGDLALTWERGSTDVPDAALEKRDLFSHQAFPDGMLIWHNIRHALAERLGFYWVDRPNDFINGFIAVSARYTSLRVPLWLLMVILAGISGLQILGGRWWRRRWLRVRGSFPVTPVAPFTPAAK